MAKKDKLGGKNATYGIYGYCDYVASKETRGQGTTKNSSLIKRLILKTDNDRANDLSVKLRRSLL